MMEARDAAIKSIREKERAMRRMLEAQIQDSLEQEKRLVDRIIKGFERAARGLAKSSERAD